MPIKQIFFWLFSTGLIGSALMVVTTRYPVRSILFLVAAFVSAACLWLIQGAEFLGLALIFVYVGAVMTLFLFVVMMLNQERLSAERIKWMAVSMAVILAVALLFFLLYPGLPKTAIQHESIVVTTSNTQALGTVLYRDYLFEFELAAFILLVGMIAAIGLTFRGQRAGNKAVAPTEQLQVSAKDRLHFAKFKD